MINCLEKSLKIDVTYTVNSFLYTLRSLPIFRDLITDDIYSSRVLKPIIRIFIILFMALRSIFLKFMYYFVMFSLTYYFFKDNLVLAFFHIFFIFTILGIFINNKLLNTSKKKYFSIILFHMDATEYFRANLFWNQLMNFILNSLCITFFGLLIKTPSYLIITLILFTFFSRLVGEALNIMFYRKYNYIWYSNTKLYGTILTVLLLISLLPFINIFMPISVILKVSIIITILGIISLIYLLKVDDYNIIYKKLTSAVDVMNSKYDKDYLKQAMVEVRDKDKIIDNKKIQGKKGYDLFNTIFFERHKEILSRSAKKYSVILLGIYIVLIYLVLEVPEYHTNIDNFIHNNLGWFVVIMYFINRGAIITQAMFFNCDHAMLRYNFYREPKTLLGLFKKRLLTVSKVNLLPALVIGIGNIVLLLLVNDFNPLIIISTFLFIIFLSIFFSVHYLVIYYLLQPFNKDMEVKKISYSIVTLITYIISYQMTNITVNSLYFSIFGLLFTIIYIVISLLLVYRLAPKTFKLN